MTSQGSRIRAGALDALAQVCADYDDFHGLSRKGGQKTGPAEPGDANAGRRHKQLTDGIDVWVLSLAGRALKKSDYLATMAKWHATTKEKYQNPTDLVQFLWELDQDNVRGTNRQFLHTTSYATIEKIDPYHRQTVVFMGAAVGDEPKPHRGEMAHAFSDYAMGRPPRFPDPRTKAHRHMSFYEWLEYHPICLGTPGIVGDAKYKNLDRVSYAIGDLAIATPAVGGGLEYVRNSNVASGVKPRRLNTSEFAPSGKGPKNAVAFVWNKNGTLLLHEHGGGFVHASAEQGHKVRCSGMLVATLGRVTVVTDQSGHYAPRQENTYDFLHWLKQSKCLSAAAHVEFEVAGSVVTEGSYRAIAFMKEAQKKHGAPFTF